MPRYRLSGRQFATSVLEEFISQAASALQIAGAAVHREPAAVIMAGFTNTGTNETAAERAVLAGLDLLSAKREHALSAEFDLRIGIASGLIWTGIPLKADGAARDLPDIVAMQAEALREQAPPGQVHITEATRGFVKGLFEYARGDPAVLRNFPEPVRAFTVVRSNETENRFEALHSRRLRFVGRDHELSALTRLWRSAYGGTGQTVFITGEPGIGKSRLVQEAELRFGAMPAARLRLFGTPHHQNSVLYPFARLIERLCCLDRTETLSMKSATLESFLHGLGLDPAEENYLFGALLSLLTGSAELPAG